MLRRFTFLLLSLAATTACRGWGRVQTGGAYDLGDRWLLLFNLEERRLGDAAMPSPYVARRSNPYGSLSLAYKF